MFEKNLTTKGTKDTKNKEQSVSPFRLPAIFIGVGIGIGIGIEKQRSSLTKPRRWNKKKRPGRFENFVPWCENPQEAIFHIHLTKAI